MEAELLKKASEMGIIDLGCVKQQIEMRKREELLNRHIYKIWQGKDGNWYTYLPEESKSRVQIKRKNRNDLEDAIIKYWGEKAENPTIREVFNEWNDRRLELNKISASTHLRNRQVFNRHYDEFGNEKIKSIYEDDIIYFLEDQIPRFNLTAKAFSNLKTITRGLFKRAKKRKLINYNIEDIFQELDTSETDFKKVIKEDYEEVFSEEETPIIIDYLVNNQTITHLAILLMFVTGVRVGEIVALKKTDFDGNTFKIRRTETRVLDEAGRYVCLVKDYPKTPAGVRTAIIPTDYEWIIKSIKRLNPFSEFVFVNNGKRISTQAVRMRLDKICKKLGIYHKSPHKIRKTYGTILLDNNIDNRLILDLMGHSDIMCTENHYHRNRKNIDRKTQIVSAIPDFKFQKAK